MSGAHSGRAASACKDVTQESASSWLTQGMLVFDSVDKPEIDKPEEDEQLEDKGLPPQAAIVAEQSALIPASTHTVEPREGHTGKLCPAERCGVIFRGLPCDEAGDFTEQAMELVQLGASLKAFERISHASDACCIVPEATRGDDLRNTHEKRDKLLDECLSQCGEVLETVSKENRFLSEECRQLLSSIEDPHDRDDEGVLQHRMVLDVDLEASMPASKLTGCKELTSTGNTAKLTRMRIMEASKRANAEQLAQQQFQASFGPACCTGMHEMLHCSRVRTKP